MGAGFGGKKKGDKGDVSLLILKCVFLRGVGHFSAKVALERV